MLIDDDPGLRIQRLKQPLWIGYAKALQIRSAMDDLLNHPPTHRMPNIAIIGNSHNGKTMILHNFLRRNTPQLQPGYDINCPPTRPVLMFQAPPVPDEARMYGQMLTALYADAAGSDREPVDSKLRRLTVILRNLQTRIILMDEFGFLQAGTPTKQRNLLNALKFVGNELRIPIVVTGVPEALNLLQSEEQVANRFEPMFLPRWKMGEDYTKLLVSIEKAMPLRHPSNLASPELAHRILVESDGIIGYMMDLMKKLGERAIRSKAERITLNDLSAANLKKIEWVHPSKRHQMPT